MKLFRSKNTSEASNTEPSNPEMAELGRNYAIAERHNDRRTMKNINRQLGSTEFSESDRESFRQGRDAYRDIPPAYSPRRNRRR